ncbi:MAG: LacI family DNA-binding transcriptional regulator [Actinobacteria bacterium]|nr:LacI family DNA-binding transcriptional regulator [Actinomycetota bacterium]
MPKRRVKLAHVALAAGVSPGTASEALRGSDRVNPRTRERVAREAARLGYIPDAQARALAIGSRRVIGLATDIPDLMGDPQTPRMFFPRMLGTLAQTLQASGCTLAMFAEPTLDALQQTPLHGLIYASVLPNNPLPSAYTRDVPVLFISFSPEVDNAVQWRVPVWTTLDHLSENRGDRPVLVTRRDSPEVFLPLRGAFRQWCQRRGIDPQELFLTSSADFGSALCEAHEDGANAVFNPTGDVLAILETCASLGLRVPEDLRLATLGSGILEPHLDPPVTCLEIDGTRSGELLAEAILALVETGTHPELHLQPFTSLEVRRSTVL